MFRVMARISRSSSVMYRNASFLTNSWAEFLLQTESNDVTIIAQYVPHGYVINWE